MLSYDLMQVIKSVEVGDRNETSDRTKASRSKFPMVEFQRRAKYTRWVEVEDRKR